jgi:RNA polymerase sigma-70 factor, ECF subfamily
MGLSPAEHQHLYRRRYGGFRRAVAALTGDDQLAHDAVQDGFAQAFRKRAQFRGGSAESWAWRIVLNKAWDLHRRERRRPGEETFALDLIGSERDPELAGAIRALPPRRRAIVFLRYYADLPYSEIARLCGISEGAVGAALAAAHEQLADALQAEGVDV